jgi:hypothetical protein
LSFIDISYDVLLEAYVDIMVHATMWEEYNIRRYFSGGAMVTGGVCLMYLQHHIRVISLVQKGRDYSEEDQRHSDRGNIPKESSSKGSNPKMRMDLCH